MVYKYIYVYNHHTHILGKEERSKYAFVRLPETEGRMFS